MSVLQHALRVTLAFTLFAGACAPTPDQSSNKAAPSEQDFLPSAIGELAVLGKALQSGIKASDNSPSLLAQWHRARTAEPKTAGDATCERNTIPVLRHGVPIYRVTFDSWVPARLSIHAGVIMEAMSNAVVTEAMKADEAEPTALTQRAKRGRPPSREPGAATPLAQTASGVGYTKKLGSRTPVEPGSSAEADVAMRARCDVMMLTLERIHGGALVVPIATLAPTPTAVDATFR